MKLLFIFSILSLLISFLLLKKSNNKLSIILWIIYSICLLFCYNTLVVYIVSCLKIDGSLLVYSIINYIVSILLFGISIYKKEIQKYKLDKKELVITLIVLAIALLIGYDRFDGLTTISYESGDSADHFNQARIFARELNILNKNNSYDIMYHYFNKVMPISYINAGFILNVLSTLKNYKVFMAYDIFCFTIYSMLFLVTLFKLFENKKKNYFYLLIVTLVYMLAFPLNNLLFGFCYMGLGIMVANLLYLTILNCKGNFNENLLFKLITLFIISFSLFFSYYLYVPPIYLALGLYYIYLWKKKKINFKTMFIFCFITLIIPFFIGYKTFMYSEVIGGGSNNIFKRVNLAGYIYDNITPIYLFFITFGYMIVERLKKKLKINYFYINIYVLSSYILLFLVLFFLNLSEMYYFYKLFYLYWVFFMIFISSKLLKKKKVIYIALSLILILMGIVRIFPNNQISTFLTKTNIYSWNADSLSEKRMLFNKSEVELMEKSTEYKDICLVNNEMPLIGNRLKNRWYYAVTGIIPIINHEIGKTAALDMTSNSFEYLEFFNNHKCVIYYYEDTKQNYNKDNYEELYSNDTGVILKKK